MPRVDGKWRRGVGLSDVGYIYFIKAGDDGPVKIGWALDPVARIATLQTGNHLPLSIVATIEGTEHHEHQIHRALKAFRVRGEWYSDCLPVQQFMRKIGAVSRPDKRLIHPDWNGERCSRCHVAVLTEDSIGTLCWPCTEYELAHHVA